MNEAGTIMVTGAAGKLGSEVVRQLRAAGRAVVAVDRRAGNGADGVTERSLDLTDVDAVRDAVRSCDGIIHLAAFPDPFAAEPDVVFGNNTRATFNVLLAATEHGVRTVVTASSVCAFGMPYAPEPFPPEYVPVDEDHPLVPRDWYGLSKQVDERTAEMFSRRTGITVVALRFHWVSTVEEQRARVAALADDPADGARELWGYVDLRDAARACLLGLTVSEPGMHPLVIAAPDSLSETPTRELLAAFQPGVTVAASMDGTAGGWATARARERLGFTARHSWRDPDVRR
ncbi:MAG: NAD(P)-dependent oxidoreductase [Actinocatenispora sp.]